MNVLGLDLSLRSTGWAVLDYDSGDLVDHGVIKTVAEPDHPNFHGEALFQIASQIQIVYDRFGWPDVGIERLVPMKGTRALIQLSMVHGVVQRWCVGWAIDPALPSVAEVKKHATGHGGADKNQMINAAFARWGVVLSDDEADAAFVASWTRCQMIDAIEAQT